MNLNLLKNFFNKENEEVLNQGETLARALTWFFIFTSGFGIFWLTIAETEEIVIVKGKLQPVGEIKKITLPTGGIAKKIKVRNGDRVSEGELLIQLDSEINQSQVNSLKYTLDRQKYLISKKEKQISLKEKEKNLTSSLISKNIKSLETKLFINKELLNSFEKLYLEGGLSQFDYLRQKEKVREIEDNLEIVEIDGSRELNIISQAIENLYIELTNQYKILSQNEVKLIETNKILKQKSIISPVDGIVFDLKQTTKGYIPQTNEIIMKIVPFKNLEAAIEIPSRKIGFVKKDMNVDINIDSYPSSDFGVLKGKIIHIGSDTLSPNQSELRDEYVYPARIKLDNQYLKINDGKNLSLQVGMTLRANIKLRKVSYLKLLLSSLQNKTDSIRQF